MALHKWEFSARFKRHAFGWKADLPMQRIKEALTEIKQVARTEPVLAAQGAVLLIQKLSPALGQVDSSSGAIGSLVDKTLLSLTDVIATAQVDSAERQQWLLKLWQALQDDQMPYIESLADQWGQLCAGPVLAAHWAEILQPQLLLAWRSRSYFKAGTACFSALLAAKQYQQLLDLLLLSPHKSWHLREWGVKALLAQGKTEEALSLAQEYCLNDSKTGIACTCEEILLAQGRVEEAYQRFALEANRGSTYLNTFRALRKKYPQQNPAGILRDLVASTPGVEGKWFAAAKDAGELALAAELIRIHPADPHTLLRAAQDYVAKEPGFAFDCALAALRWMAQGYGYDIHQHDVFSALQIAQQLAGNGQAGMATDQLQQEMRDILDKAGKNGKFVAACLAQLQGA